MREALIPVLLGADLNCYGMARAFYEAYGVPSIAFGRQALGATRHSRFLRSFAVPDLSDPRICREVLLDFAKARPEKNLLLLACTDEYARILIENKAALEPYYLLPYPNEKALPLMEKDAFYRGVWDSVPRHTYLPKDPHALGCAIGRTAAFLSAYRQALAK